MFIKRLLGLKLFKTCFMSFFVKENVILFIGLESVFGDVSFDWFSFCWVFWFLFFFIMLLDFLWFFVLLLSLLLLLFLFFWLLKFRFSKSFIEFFWLFLSIFWVIFLVIIFFGVFDKGLKFSRFGISGFIIDLFWLIFSRRLLREFMLRLCFSYFFMWDFTKLFWGVKGE